LVYGHQIQKGVASVVSDTHYRMKAATNQDPIAEVLRVWVLTRHGDEITLLQRVCYFFEARHGLFDFSAVVTGASKGIGAAIAGPIETEAHTLRSLSINSGHSKRLSRSGRRSRSVQFCGPAQDSRISA
jgi:hypothetical protein